MEESGNFRHEHPLVLLNEEQISNQSEEAKCWMCEEKVSAPCFSCSECNGFYLHKVCAETPSTINHPFHDNHPLVLFHTPSSYGRHICDFCYGTCKKFVYRCSCSCDLDFHIKCALFTYNIAEKNLKELDHVVLEDPLITSENDGKKLEDHRKCFVCWESLTNYTYFSPNCGFNLHKKCVELPFKINHMCDREHPLILQFYSRGLPCKICQRTQENGFVYGCSLCKFVVDIECLSPSPVVEDKSHLHPFTLFRRRVPFICDACGNEGNYASYICCTCNIIVHKRCISLPRIIKTKWHDDHLIFHNYFLEEKDLKSWDCIICHDKVNAELGSYSCLDCKIVFHVNCVIKDENSYFVVSLENKDEKSSDSLELLDISSITSVFERNDAGEAIEIIHFKHVHNLMLGDKIMEYDKSCDGCMLPISDSFYYCPQCDFFLHKACAELPKSKHVWHHDCRKPLMLTSGKTFKCKKCGCVSNAFAYTCIECDRRTCLRCVIALTPGVVTSPKHEHPLVYYKDYEGQCSACGHDRKGAFRCKDCKFNFALDHRCFSLPTAARHKCDEHLLSLTYHDDNTYSESHYCDICEERRDPSRWFYHCATCDTSAHVKCVLGQYSFVKLGGSWRFSIHPHRLAFTRKIYYYPNCNRCNEPCDDLALECTMSGCDYVVQWEC